MNSLVTRQARDAAEKITAQGDEWVFFGPILLAEVASAVSRLMEEVPGRRLDGVHLGGKVADLEQVSQCE